MTIKIETNYTTSVIKLVTGSKNVFFRNLYPFIQFAVLCDKYIESN